MHNPQDEHPICLSDLPEWIEAHIPPEGSRLPPTPSPGPYLDPPSRLGSRLDRYPEDHYDTGGESQWESAQEQFYVTVTESSVSSRTERPPAENRSVSEEDKPEDFRTPPETAAPSVASERPKTIRPEDTVQGCGYPVIPDPADPARVLGPRDLKFQRIAFLGTILSLNIACAAAAIWAHDGIFVFVFILFIKSKDFLSVIISAVGLLVRAIWRFFRPPKPVPQQWILTLIPAYSESEEQIVKTIYSLRDNDVEPHKQVMVVCLDGKPRDVKCHMTRIIREFERPYVTSKFKRGVLKITAGFMQDVPVLVLEKVKNSGKKDSLILCHDLFNYPRPNVPLYTRLLREELWKDVLPVLTEGMGFAGFDMVFCTDADSTIYKGAVAGLANALARDKNAIAACGLVLVELEPGFEWSFWNLYQQFQYTFGQFVRRRAEGFIGKVTCLPGCITMIAVRPEMAGAIRKYAEPITIYPVIHHQVQYLGTDRRLTYSMLSQGKHLHTLFVPEAVSETVAPQSLQHYLSQRRRWGSNAYFNNYFYWMGDRMILITRVAASIEVIRLSMVYYRIVNTCLFIKGLIHSFSFMKLIPLLVVSQLPTCWFLFNIFVLEPELRKRAHKLLIGFCINKFISPFISITVFTKVAKNVGSQVWGLKYTTWSNDNAVWGMSGVAASSTGAVTGAEPAATPAEGDATEKGEAGLGELTEFGREIEAQRDAIM